MSIVSVAEVKEQLRISTSADDSVLTQRIAETEFILLDYLGWYDFAEFLYDSTGADEDQLYYEYGEDWPDSVMAVAVFRAAMFASLADTYDNRANTPLTAAARAILRRFRLPVLSDGK